MTDLGRDSVVADGDARAESMFGVQFTAPRCVFTGIVVLQQNEDLIFHAHHWNQSPSLPWDAP